MFYCEICWIKFSNQHEIVSHFLSNIHRSAANFKPQEDVKFFCSVCSVYTTSQEGLDQHNNSIKHNARVSVKANRHLFKSITKVQALGKEGILSIGIVKSFTDTNIYEKLSDNDQNFSKRNDIDSIKINYNLNNSLEPFPDKKLEDCNEKRMILKPIVNTGLTNLNRMFLIFSSEFFVKDFFILFLL